MLQHKSTGIKYRQVEDYYRNLFVHVPGCFVCAQLIHQVFQVLLDQFKPGTSSTCSLASANWSPSHLHSVGNCCLP